MIYKTKLSNLFLSLVMVVSFGCDTTRSNDEYLLELKCDDDWLSEEQGSAIIFISDARGRLLAEHEWSGNAKFRLYLNDESYNLLWDESEVTVTWIRKYNSSDLNARITTVMNVPVGSSWVLNGLPRDQIKPLNQPADIEFLDAPFHNSYIVSSIWNSESAVYGQLGKINDFIIYNNPEKLFASIATQDGDRQFRWLPNITPGSQLVPSSDWTSASKQQINLFGDFGRAVNMYVSGIENPGSRYEGQYFIDHVDAYANENSVEANIPDSTFTDFRTRLYLDEIGLHGYIGEWHDILFYGQMPDEITVLAADFEFISASVNNFELATTGEFMETISSWSDEKINAAKPSYWHVFSDDSTTKYILPTFPQGVIDRFGIDRDEFALYRAYVQDYLGVQNYQESLVLAFERDEYLYDQIAGWNSRGKLYSNQQANETLSISARVRGLERFEIPQKN